MESSGEPTREVGMLVIGANGTARFVPGEPDLKALQKAVGGYIETIDIVEEAKVTATVDATRDVVVDVRPGDEAYVNEEGLIEGLTDNMLLSTLGGREEFPYVGTGVIVIR